LWLLQLSESLVMRAFLFGGPCTHLACVMGVLYKIEEILVSNSKLDWNRRLMPKIREMPENSAKCLGGFPGFKIEVKHGG
jgi:hypothetical protein